MAFSVSGELGNTGSSSETVRKLIWNRPNVQLPAMPRATSERFSKAHQPSAKKSGASRNHGDSSSSSVRNPIFNTERFGQHILKNPSIAQEYVAASFGYDVQLLRLL